MVPAFGREPFTVHERCGGRGARHGTRGRVRSPFQLHDTGYRLTAR